LYCVGVTFAYDGQKTLFTDLDFGIDMASRSEYSLVDYVLQYTDGISAIVHPEKHTVLDCCFFL